MESVDDDVNVGYDGLNNDIASVLDPQHFGFKGYYYHSVPQPTAPNPCIKISGLGVVGLPLNEREALAIASYASIPMSNAQKKVVEDTMRTMWTIEAGKVEFQNPLWGAWLERTYRELCSKLGLSVNEKARTNAKVKNDTDDKMDQDNDDEMDEDNEDETDEDNDDDMDEATDDEVYEDTDNEKDAEQGMNVNSQPHFLQLRELRLCGKGYSCVSSENDSLSTTDALGTAIVILPSEYSGGQIELSYSSLKWTVDFSSQSPFGTTILASYKEVQSQMQPITSGYQLALVYELEPPSTVNFPRPSASDPGKPLQQLESILKKWKQTTPKRLSYDGHIAYVLEQDYGNEALKQGEFCLDGVDRQRAAIVRDAAEKQKFKVFLATMEMYRYGQVDETWVDDDDVPPMSSGHGVTDRMSIKGFVDLDGNALPAVGTINFDEGQRLIPRDPFNDKETNSYDLSEWGSLEHIYRRTVLVLMPEDNLSTFYWSVGGIKYAMKQLENYTIPPSAKDTAWAERILYHLDNLSSSEKSKDVLKPLLNMSLDWSNARMWNKLMEERACGLHMLKIDDVIRALKAFGLEVVQKSIETILARSSAEETLDLLYDLPLRISTEDAINVLAWCRANSEKTLSSLKPYIPTILHVIQKVGIEEFKRLVWPNILKLSPEFDFSLKLAQALRENRESILQRQREILAQPPFQVIVPDGWPPVDLAPYEAEIDEMIEHCLQQASSLWFVPAGEPSQPFGHSSDQHDPIAQARRKEKQTVNRIIQILANATAYDHQEVCRKLFDNILKSPGSFEVKFTRLYNPLISRLPEAIQNSPRDICSSPFVDFLRAIIATYLHDILGEKTKLRNYHLQKVGCGCEKCGSLDVFMLDPSEDKYTFKLGRKVHNHLEKSLRRVPELCTFRTIRSGKGNAPLGLQVTKLPEIMHLSTWEGRVEEATALLAKIGPDDVIARIMGAQYQDVKDALAGSRPFGSSKPLSNAAAARVDITSSSSVAKKRKLAELDCD